MTKFKIRFWNLPEENHEIFSVMIVDALAEAYTGHFGTACCSILRGKFMLMRLLLMNLFPFETSKNCLPVAHLLPDSSIHRDFSRYSSSCRIIDSLHYASADVFTFVTPLCSRNFLLLAATKLITVITEDIQPLGARILQYP